MPLPKVLIVNDHLPTLTALEAALNPYEKDHEYAVYTAPSGKDALRLLLRLHFAVILLDVSMPEMDGFETAELIHSHPASSTTPIIFLTAHYANEAYPMRGYRLGAVDFLISPVLPEVLQAKVAVFAELERRTLALERKTRELEELNASLEAQRMQALERHNELLQFEVQERRLAEQRAYELATRDALTGVLNRRALMDELAHAIPDVDRRRETLALLFMDLNRFKAVNDTLGHDVGDQLLIQVARRIKSCLREADIVARLGGDEFVVLVKSAGAGIDTYLDPVVEKIRTTLTAPFQIGAHTVLTSASIGMALYPRDGMNAVDLLKHADTAMYQVKRLTGWKAQRNRAR
ncbi:MAG: diguanylate cyclase domain-containing protein [Burkholderiaceae bacterium]